MKVLAAILATLIFFLTMQPLLSNSGFIAENKANASGKCCVNKKKAPSSESKQDKDKNCCNNGHCDNPFLTCSNCSFISHNEFPFSFAQVTGKTKKIRLINDKELSSYAQDCWHPPQGFGIETM